MSNSRLGLRTRQGEIKGFIETLGAVDVDAQSFITSSGITNTTEINAINNLVVQLKINNLWSSLYAIYPFIGGSSSTNKFNLKDPRDVNAAFRLTFTGGVTHDSLGILFNGVNGYANTFFVPNSNFSDRNNMTFYVNINRGTLGGGGFPATMYSTGASNASSATGLVVRTTTKTAVFTGESFNLLSASNATTTGVFIGNALLGVTNLLVNTTIIATSSVSVSGSMSSVSLFMGVNNQNGTPQSVTWQNVGMKMSIIGRGLTYNQLITLQTIDNQYQSLLGR